MNNWNCIKNRKIIDLLIGDSYLQNNPSLEYFKMPYMKGYQICEFAKSLGLNIVYNEKKLPRWKIMDKVIDYVIDNNKINDFFCELISKKRFEYLVDIEGYYGEPEALYWNIVHNLFKRINEYLRFEDEYINYDIKHNEFKLLGFDDENEEIEQKDFNEIIKDFCKTIKKEGLPTRYGLIKNIVDPGFQGGNGKVLFGKLNDKDVAIKILITEDEKKKLRFFEEFLNVLMALEKVPGVVELYLFDFLKIGGKEIQYIVMKKYDKNLSKVQIKTQDDLIKFALELAEIIDNVHKNGIIHRDIKPENIMVNSNGKIILTDFGIAYYDPNEFENTGHTISKEFLGNRGFSAPEQLIKGVSPKVTMDIYSYGQILQFVVTGNPHTGTNKINIGRFISGEKIDIVDKIISKCLMFEQEKRYQSMKDIIKELLLLIDYNDNKKIKKQKTYNNSINANDIYEFICINDVASTKELAEEFNYDIYNLKKELIKLFKVKRLIKPNSLTDNPNDDDCNWTRY